jgi:Raf kinase inhibitor-like YbhB/YbcL family protein
LKEGKEWRNRKKVRSYDSIAKSIRLLSITFCFLFLLKTSLSANIEDNEMSTLRILSPAFKQNDPIPKKYSCEGEDISPPLSIKGSPSSGVVSYAIIVDDPDAPMGVFDHWIAWNIAPDKIDFEEGVKVPAEGKNGFGVNKYRGPCPPPGKPHRYFFKVYALDQKIGLLPGSSKEDLIKAMNGHILAQGELIGTFQR